MTQPTEPYDTDFGKAATADIALDRRIDAYISDYVFEGDEGPYQPNSAELMMFSDLLHGWEAERALGPVQPTEPLAGGPWFAELMEEHEPEAPDSWRIYGNDDSLEATLCEFWSGEHDNEAMAKHVAALLNAAPVQPTEPAPANSETAAPARTE